MARVLVTGASGQIGTELVPALRRAYGTAQVLATDLREPVGGGRAGAATGDVGTAAGEVGAAAGEAGAAAGEVGAAAGDGPFRRMDCTDPGQVAAAVREHRPEVIYHLAALLSAVSEDRPQDAYQVNLGGLLNVLEAARQSGCAVFNPSSIAVFGNGTPPDPAPQDTIQRPTTMYGLTKVTGELLCDYYHVRFGVDTRGLRYPGLISHSAMPGGGSTDYAVEIFHHAVRDGRYLCPLEPDTRMDMMYMPDAVRGAMELMEADPARLRHRNAFNVTSMQLTPAVLADEIARHLPAFRIDYVADPVRQAIVDSWPRRVDDSEARAQWDWKPEFDLEATVRDMLAHMMEVAP